MADSSEMTPARAAAEWWAAQIGSPVFRVVGDRPGERDFKASFFETFASDEAARHPVTDEAGRLFTDALEARIAEDLAAEVKRAEERNREALTDPTARPYAASVGLYVDYGPDPILADPAKAAGVSLSRFPIKSGMAVCADHVVASVGYGSRRRLVWSTPEWEQTRPECQEWRMDGYDVHPDLGMCGLPKYHDGECGSWKPDPEVCGRCGEQRIAHHTKAAYESEDRCRFEAPHG